MAMMVIDGRGRRREMMDEEMDEGGGRGGPCWWQTSVAQSLSSRARSVARFVLLPSSRAPLGSLQ